MSDKVVTIDGVAHEMQVERDGARVRSAELEIEVTRLGPNEAEIRAGDRTHIVPFVVIGTNVHFSFDGEIYTAEVTEKGARTRARHRDHSMAAPMPGLILKILVKAGDVVTRGTPVVVLEAMKMEHQIVATHDGTIRAVNCKEGEMVQPGVDLVEIA